MIHSAIVLSCVLNETYTPLLFTVTMFQVCQYLQLSQDLIGQQLLPQVVSALYNDGQQPPVGQVTVRRRFSDAPAETDERMKNRTTQS